MFNLTSYIRSIKGRTKWLGLFVGCAFVVFTLRLFYIQVIQHDHYTALAKQTQVTKNTIFAARGELLARDGSSGTVPLVLNETVYTVFADPHEVKDTAKIKDVLHRVAGGEVVNDSLQYLSDTSRRYLVLARNVTRTQAELIQKEELDGVGLQKGSKRVYPEGTLASQLLGYVNSDGEGQYGLEGALNSRLAGTNGVLQSVTDVRRIPLTIGDDNTEVPAVDGEDVVLSVDRNVQYKLEEMLKTHYDKVHPTNASAVVMDPSSGQIVAMANYPTYDPNSYSTVTDYSLFQNRVTDNAYEAGSVMKTLTVASGLDAGVITPTSTSPNPTGCTSVEDTTICNVTRNGVTNPTTQQTLLYSFNTGAVNVLRSLGGGTINKTARNKLYDYLTNRFRLGEATGIEQAGEAKGVLYSPDDDEGNNVRYANMTFGQGMTTTMLQVASAFSSAVNGGTYYRPTLVYGTKTASGTLQKQAPTVVQQNVVSSQASSEMRNLVYHTRHDNSVSRAVDPVGYYIGGKTGTAQTIDPKTGQYTSDLTIGSYLGFVGGSDSETPNYVIMIRMDFAQGGTFAGSIEANTMFGEMARWLINYDGIPKV